MIPEFAIPTINDRQAMPDIVNSTRDFLALNEMPTLYREPFLYLKKLIQAYKIEELNRHYLLNRHVFFRELVKKVLDKYPDHKEFINGVGFTYYADDIQYQKGACCMNIDFTTGYLMSWTYNYRNVGWAFEYRIYSDFK